MRRPFTINTVDRGSGTLSLHFAVTGEGTEWLARVRPTERVDMYGPLGRPFQIEPRSRHILLIAEGRSITGVRALADEAVSSHRQVTVLLGARSAADVYPSSLLPDEVEYVVATQDGSFGDRGDITDLVPKFEAWADQAFASGPYAFLSRLATLARGRQARLGVATLTARRGRAARCQSARLGQARRRAWLQVLVEQDMGCAAGTCLGCVVMTRTGPQRLCREGPTFASDDIAWETRQP